MISEREDPITLINGQKISKNYSKKYNKIYVREDTYTDNFYETQQERNRILNYKSKPCPIDFPERLKQYWDGNLEYSLTPYQTGWNLVSKKKK
tara:strand:- start:9870 stop:10148 length:279 start_codon:yes stop_codon:yes gene_type:complete